MRIQQQDTHTPIAALHGNTSSHDIGLTLFKSRRQLQIEPYSMQRKWHPSAPQVGSCTGHPKQPQSLEPNSMVGQFARPPHRPCSSRSVLSFTKRPICSLRNYCRSALVNIEHHDGLYGQKSSVQHMNLSRYSSQVLATFQCRVRP